MGETKELTLDTVDRTDAHQLRQVFNLSPRNLTEAVEYAKLMAATELVPKSFIGKPQTVLIAVQMGMELGLSALQAVNSIAVINGRATMWGDAVLAMVIDAKVLDMDFGTGGYLERPPDEALKLKEGRFEIKRKGWKETMVRTFSMDDATRAGLAQRSGPTGPWATYTGRMLQMRARSWALRDACPDVLKGLRIREEEMDTEAMLKDGTTGATVAADMPRRRVVEADTVKAGTAETILKAGNIRPEIVHQPQPQAAQETKKLEAPVVTSWRGQIANVSIQKGNDGKNGKPKSNDRFSIVGKDGQTYHTFSSTAATLAKEAKSTGEEMVIDWKASSYGKDAVNVKRAAEVDQPPTTTEEEFEGQSET